VARHKELQREMRHLVEAEEELDQLVTKCNLQLKLLTEDPHNKKYPFVTVITIMEVPLRNVLPCSAVKKVQK